MNDLAQTFDQLGLVEIQDSVKRGQEEHLHLDFKTIRGANFSSADDKRNLARSISGFANSAGGIIVWGIDARKNAEGIDCASGTSEIGQLRLLLSRLNELTGEAVSPIPEGVRHKTIESAEDCGFAATLVPESQSPPHMAKLGEDRYYKRSGASFYRMEHFDLEDMFGRRQKPRLGLVFEEGKKRDDGTEELIVLMMNQGRAVARHAGFLIGFKNVDIISVGPQMQNNSGINAGRPVVGFDNSNGVVHPNGIRVNLGSIYLRRKDQAQTIEGDVTIYCEGTQSVKQFLTVAVSEPTTVDEPPKSEP